MKDLTKVNFRKLVCVSLVIGQVIQLQAQATTPDFGYADAGIVAVNHFLEINSSSTTEITLATFDAFGASIANLGDLDGSGTGGVTTIAVGAVADAGGGFLRGAVYIINLNTDGTILGTPAKITHGSTGITLANLDNFGTSVANLGDLDIGLSGTDETNSLITIAVGAVGDDTEGTSKGAIYLINLDSSAGIVGTPVKITDNTTGINIKSNALFGASVANLGDLDGAGTGGETTIAVGANGDNTGGTNGGAVYIINLDSDGAVVGNNAVKIDDNHSKITITGGDLFGQSIANLGDLDIGLSSETDKTNSITIIAVGASGDGTGGGDRGAVYLINLDSSAGIVGTPVELDSDTTEITLEDNDFFGRSIENLGDLDVSGTGVTTIAVGASGGEKVYTINLESTGAVAETAGIINATSLNITTDGNDSFGASIASIGDLDGDGIDEIIVGEPLEDTEGQDRGEIHIISFAKKQYFFTTSDTADITLPAVETGSPAPTYTLSPTSLPAGLTFSDSARTITGTPTETQAATEYTLTATIGSDTDTFAFNIETGSSAPDEIILTIDVFLQGPYNTTTSIMNASLLTANNDANIIPTESPYGDGATVESTVFNTIAGDDAIVDWVQVSLHDPNDTSVVIVTVPALLQRNGNVVALDGSSALQIQGVVGDYKVSINHRNHIPVITDAAQSLSTTETAIDFTNDLTIVTGGSNAMAEVATGIYALFSGDVNGNNQVQVDDYNAAIQDVGRGGYLTSDVDMNGELQVSDINFVLKTLGKGAQF